MKILNLRISKTITNKIANQLSVNNQMSKKSLDLAQPII